MLSVVTTPDENLQLLQRCEKNEGIVCITLGERM
jgi:hypothetical protein